MRPIMDNLTGTVSVMRFQIKDFRNPIVQFFSCSCFEILPTSNLKTIHPSCGRYPICRPSRESLPIVVIKTWQRVTFEP